MSDEVRERPGGSHRFDFAAAMGWLQQDLLTALTKGRELLPHPVEIGDNSELHWIDMFEKFLPKRYTVGKGFVIDVNGEVSEQIDAMIFDRQYSPQIFRNGETVYVPAESVYAVFEVKQDLSKAHIDAAAEKISSVRRLERTSTSIRHLQGVSDGKEIHQIIGGILTLSSEWNPPMGESLVRSLKYWDRDESRVDIGCAAGYGAFENLDESIELWSNSGQTLVWFAARLLVRLQRIGTVPQMDIARWAEIALSQISPHSLS